MNQNFQSSTCWPNPCSTTDIYGTGVCRVELLANGMVFATSEPFVLPKWSTGLYVTPTVTYDVSASESYLIGAYLGVNLRVDGLSGGPWGFNVVYDNVRLNGAGGSSTGGCQGTPPLVTIGGGDTIHASACQSFVLPTATCTDPCTSDNLTNMTVYEDCAGNIPPLAGTGACDSQLSILEMGDSYDVATPGTYIVYYDCTNAAGAVGSAQLTVIVHPDTTDPTLTCPPAVLATATAGSCEAAVSVTQIGNPVYDDACSTLGITVANNAPAGLVFPVGMTTVTWTATDAAGNTSTCAQVVTVKETQAPTITCPMDITAPAATGSCTTNLTFAATATDDCTSSTAINIGYRLDGVGNITSPYAFPVGTNVVTATATDASNNSTNCTFKVIVYDNQPPTITCGGAVTNCVGPFNYSFSQLGVSGNDNCSGVNVTCNPAPGFTLLPGITNIVCNATDGAGNYSTCTVPVTGVKANSFTYMPEPAWASESSIITNYYGVMAGQTITVTAHSYIDIQTSTELPDCWEVKKNGISVGKVLSVPVDHGVAETTTIVAVSGTSSITNVVVVLGPIDVDIDSDNTGEFAMPDHSYEEDQVEAISGDDLHPGKVILVNDNDSDRNGPHNSDQGLS